MFLPLFAPETCDEYTRSQAACSGRLRSSDPRLEGGILVSMRSLGSENPPPNARIHPDLRVTSCWTIFRPRSLPFYQEFSYLNRIQCGPFEKLVPTNPKRQTVV